MLPGSRGVWPPMGLLPAVNAVTTSDTAVSTVPGTQVPVQIPFPACTSGILLLLSLLARKKTPPVCKDVPQSSVTATRTLTGAETATEKPDSGALKCGTKALGVQFAASRWPSFDLM